jgi:hypothetical protein
VLRGHPLALSARRAKAQAISGAVTENWRIVQPVSSSTKSPIEAICVLAALRTWRRPTG